MVKVEVLNLNKFVEALNEKGGIDFGIEGGGSVDCGGYLLICFGSVAEA